MTATRVDGIVEDVDATAADVMAGRAELGPGIARWYLRFLVFRHASILSLLMGFLLLASSAPTAIRTAGGAFLVAGFVGFALSMTVLVIPLIWLRLRGSHPSMTTWLMTSNNFTGHGLVPEAIAASDRWHSLTPRTLHVLVGVEIALFVLFPLVAIL